MTVWYAGVTRMAISIFTPNVVSEPISQYSQLIIELTLSQVGRRVGRTRAVRSAVVDRRASAAGAKGLAPRAPKG